MIHLSRGDDSLTVAPDIGGAIIGWTHGGVHQLRRPSPEAVSLGQVGAMGCFPLLPFCNRIAYRRFTWAGRAYELAANFGDHPHAIHGAGWQLPWRVEEAADTHVTLSLHHDPSALSWPFAFAARLIYRLTDRGLTIRIEATNLHAAPAPMGIGAHPYFPRGPGAAIAFQATGVWFNRDSLPFRHGPVSAAWDHASGRDVEQEPLDNCFTRWRGEARIPGMRIEADPVFGNLQVFTPADADFLCVEPVSHVPDAINRPDLPAAQAMSTLGVGETLSGEMVFSPEEAS
jgi:aldose 1-epimerase